MKNSQIKNNNQLVFFDMIKKVPHKGNALVNVVADLLGIGPDAAYRRMRGDKPVTLEETIILCRHFNISLNSLIGLDNYNLHPLENIKYIDGFSSFVKTLSNNIENTKLSDKCEMIMSAVDVPMLHIMVFKELTLFKLFSWSKNAYDFKGAFETFVKEINTDEFFNDDYKKILNNYQLIPSTEICTDNINDTILNLISYHYEMKHFNDKTTPLLLCEQLLCILNTIQNRAVKGTKGANNTPFKLYIGETDISNTLIFFKSEEKSTCMVRLYDINGISISDENFCRETENWLTKSIQQASLISGTSVRERFNFFNAQKEKIENFIKKFE